ncbi:MAG: hypothetical protein V4671_26420 [Armatimonadota bacterium]
MRPYKRLSHLSQEYVWEPLFVGKDKGTVGARFLWGLLFSLLSCFTLLARIYSEPLDDLTFAQCTGIVSALAILCTLRSLKNPWRLHWLMLGFCCFQFVVIQRPTGFSPHGQFLRSFATIKNGMTTDEVALIMQNGTISADIYFRWSLPVSSRAARRKWLHPGYSGRLNFDHTGPGIDGFFWVDLVDGRVVSTHCFNE